MIPSVPAFWRGLAASWLLVMASLLVATLPAPGQNSDTTFYPFYPGPIPPMTPSAPLDDMFVGRPDPEWQRLLDATQASGTLPPLFHRTTGGATVVTVRWESREGAVTQRRSAQLVVGGAPEPTIPFLTAFAGWVLLLWRRRPAFAQGTTDSNRPAQPCRVRPPRRARLAAMRRAPGACAPDQRSVRRYHTRRWISDLG